MGRALLIKLGEMPFWACKLLELEERGLHVTQKWGQEGAAQVSAPEEFCILVCKLVAGGAGWRKDPVPFWVSVQRKRRKKGNEQVGFVFPRAFPGRSISASPFS